MKRYRNNVKPIKQKYSNDCAIAALAMALHEPYFKVFAAAKRAHKHFCANHKSGADVYAVAMHLGYDCKHRTHFGFLHRHHCRVKQRKRVPIKGPCIASVPSVNNRGGGHAVVYSKGVIYDPSRKRQVNEAHTLRRVRTWYYDFQKESRTTL